jgi:hypothetical protein
MADNNSAYENSIRSYLAERGGSVADAGGRGLTDEMARALGVDRPAELSAVLGQMEDSGVITREMRGLRTYRIALVDGNGAPPAAVAAAGATPTADAGGAAGSRALRGGVATEAAPAPAGGAVRLRDALGRKPSAPAPVAAAVVTPEEIAEPVPGRAVSLRDAISQRATASVAAPPEPPTVRPTAGRATDEWAAPPPADASPGRTVSLRDAIAGTDASAPSWDWDSPPDSRFDSPPGGYRASVGDTSRAAPFPEPAYRSDDDSPGRGRSRTKGSRTRPRLTVPVPAVKTAPSTPIITAVGIAVAGLLLVTLITVVVTRGTTSHLPAIGTPDSSADACRVVTTVEAALAFGEPAGDPHFVLGSCVYDDGTNELIVDVARQNGRALFDSSRSSVAQGIPGIGDDAYYSDGRLRVLKGSSLMLLTLSPYAVDKPNPKLVALAAVAAARL